MSPFLSLSLGLSLSFVSLVLVISFSFSRLSLSFSPSSRRPPIGANTRPCVCVGRCVRARAPGECVEWSFLRNLARVRFHPGRCCCWWGRNSARPRNGPPRRPRDSLIHVATLTNAVFALPYPAAATAATADHPLGPSTSAPSRPSLYPSLLPGYLLCSLHRGEDRAPNQLKRSTITWFQRSVRHRCFVFFVFYSS